LELKSSLHIIRASDAPEADENVLGIGQRPISSFEIVAENAIRRQYGNILMRLVIFFPLDLSYSTHYFLSLYLSPPSLLLLLEQQTPP
jgi:hypothetical protein